jgi:uncharacterized protein YkwD
LEVMMSTRLLIARRWSVAALALPLLACDEPGSSAASQADTDVATGVDTTRSDATSPDASRPDTSTPDTEALYAVCDRWLADRASRSEGTWTDGSTRECEAGTYSQTGLDNTLVQVNLYRWLAGLPAVTLDIRKSADAQACAVTMHANRDIEHDLPDSWACRTDSAIRAARMSNLATLPAVGAVDLYMDDEGIASLGHRRWILSNSLGPIGVGSTNQYSCLHVIGGSGRAGARFVAWPPPGLVPMEALKPAAWADIDKAGWSVQSDSVDVNRAELITVTKDGVPVEVDTWDLGDGYGSAYGLGITPKGFRTEVGSTYRVTIESSRFDVITYEFTPVDCR